MRLRWRVNELISSVKFPGVTGAYAAIASFSGLRLSAAVDGGDLRGKECRE
jgi:hypothetical protein